MVALLTIYEKMTAKKKIGRKYLFSFNFFIFFFFVFGILHNVVCVAAPADCGYDEAYVNETEDGVADVRNFLYSGNCHCPN